MKIISALPVLGHPLSTRERFRCSGLPTGALLTVPRGVHSPPWGLLVNGRVVDRRIILLLKVVLNLLLVKKWWLVAVPLD